MMEEINELQTTEETIPDLISNENTSIDFSAVKEAMNVRVRLHFLVFKIIYRC